MPGIVTVQLPDGTARWIEAYYHGGIDPTEDPLDDLLTLYAEFPNLEFLALDAYWIGGEVGDGWANNAARPFFGGMPRTLAASAVLGDVTTFVPGDADTWGIWRFRGPGSPIATNLTSGRTWSWRADSPIPAGRTVTVDTRPRVLSVVDDLGNDLYDDLNLWPDFWPLEPGVNDLHVEIVGATAASRADYEADVRWQAAW
ncbi:hypothetical protein amrb99_98210 [Actinomadura sp. RB99]|nr:hypothetical protein [Actinomadura sp. RB99]